MNIELIDEGRLKIALSGADMRELGVSFDELDYNKPETRCMIFELLCKARSQTRFCPQGESMLIEVFPAVGGGCTMYFTQLERSSRHRLRLKKREISPCVCSFDSIDDLLDLCAVMRDGYDEILRSDLYMYSDKPYLILHIAAAPTKRLCAMLNEYCGSFVCSHQMYAQICEYGKKITADDAVAKIAGTG